MCDYAEKKGRMWYCRELLVESASTKKAISCARVVGNGSGRDTDYYNQLAKCGNEASRRATRHISHRGYSEIKPPVRFVGVSMSSIRSTGPAESLIVDEEE